MDREERQGVRGGWEGQERNSPRAPVLCSREDKQLPHGRSVGPEPKSFLLSAVTHVAVAVFFSFIYSCMHSFIGPFSGTP